MESSRSTNIHHIVPKSRQCEGFRTNATINKERWYVNKHNSLHALFGNDLPHEAIDRFISVYCQAVLRPEFVHRIQQVLSDDIENIYVDDVLRYKTETRDKVFQVINR